MASFQPRPQRGSVVAFDGPRARCESTTYFGSRADWKPALYTAQRSESSPAHTSAPPTTAAVRLVRPFVALHEGDLVAVPSDAEVARVLRDNVADLLRADAALPPGVAFLELRYPLGGEDVWGATARILRTFSRVLRCALSPGEAAPPTAAAAGLGS